MVVIDGTFQANCLWLLIHMRYFLTEEFPIRTAQKYFGYNLKKAAKRQILNPGNRWVVRGASLHLISLGENSLGRVLLLELLGDYCGTLSLWKADHASQVFCFISGPRIRDA